MATLQGKSVAVIALISPVLGICFTIYLMLIASNAMRGEVGGENVMDFFQRSIAWAIIITMGCNIQYYTYVVDFFNGLGADLSGAISGSSSVSSGAMLDELLNLYLDRAIEIYDKSSGFESIAAAVCAVILLLGGGFLLAVAAAYILLAQIALGMLLAIGPIFISLALFPATRKFFDAWIGQCVNYVLLTVLFCFLATILTDLVHQMFVNDTNVFAQMAMTVVSCVAFILVALNIPSLASALSGGVGISTMVGKPLQAARSVTQALQSLKGTPKTGGSVTGK